MKRNPNESEILELMQPGILSRDGFLGTDKRNLADIIQEDTSVLEAETISREQLGDLLDELHEAADSGLESTVSVFGDKLKVRLIEGMGRIPCPFRDGDHEHKATINVEYAGKKLTFTPLDAHMIRTHGFFQGKGSPYRIEPRELCELYRFCKEN